MLETVVEVIADVMVELHMVTLTDLSHR